MLSLSSRGGDLEFKDVTPATSRTRVSRLALGRLPHRTVGAMVARVALLDLQAATMQTIARGFGIALVVGAIACAGHARAATDAPVATLTDGFDANVRRDVETLRAAT